MQLYAIVRRHIADTEAGLVAADQRSTAERLTRVGVIEHVRSYVVQEPDGWLGTLCFYEAVSAEALVDHARAAEIPADEVLPVLDVVIAREETVA